jgi:hypothetical protein
MNYKLYTLCGSETSQEAFGEVAMDNKEGNVNEKISENVYSFWYTIWTVLIFIRELEKKGENIEGDTAHKFRCLSNKARVKADGPRGSITNFVTAHTSYIRDIYQDGATRRYLILVKAWSTSVKTTDKKDVEAWSQNNDYISSLCKRYDMTGDETLEGMLDTDNIIATTVFVFLDHTLMWTQDVATAMKIMSKVHTSLHLNQRTEAPPPKRSLVPTGNRHGCWLHFNHSFSSHKESAIFHWQQKGKHFLGNRIKAHSFHTSSWMVLAAIYRYGIYPFGLKSCDKNKNL